MNVCDSKYIVFEHDNEYTIVVFNNSVNHSNIALVSQSLLGKPVSAGFINIYIDENGLPVISAYGESMSLHLQANRERDSKLAKRLFNIEV